MHDSWLISDTHFTHKRMLEFVRADGITPCRSFSSVEEMDEIMIQNWNNVVKDGDYIYHLGDITFNFKNFIKNIAPRLKGKKRWILGNHEPSETKQLMQLLPFFEKVYGVWKTFPEHKFMATHVPYLPSQFRRDTERNVHGHMHEKSLKNPIYANVCVEMTNYTPVNLEEVHKYFGN